jgi:hypothetical protein
MACSPSTAIGFIFTSIPVYLAGKFRASHFAARFLLPGSHTEIPQAVRVVSIKEQVVAHISPKRGLRTASRGVIQASFDLGAEPKGNHSCRC